MNNFITFNLILIILSVPTFFFIYYHNKKTIISIILSLLSFIIIIITSFLITDDITNKKYAYDYLDIENRYIEFHIALCQKDFKKASTYMTPEFQNINNDETKFEDFKNTFGNFDTSSTALYPSRNIVIKGNLATLQTKSMDSSYQILLIKIDGKWCISSRVKFSGYEH